eukprot:861211-Amphidinium_carterae.1
MLHDMPDEDALFAKAFSIEQPTPQGTMKFRRGEDWRRSCHNATVRARLSPVHHTIDDYASVAVWWRDQGLGPTAEKPLPVAQAVEWQEESELSGMLLWNHDHAAAYRQLPLRHPQHAYLVLRTPQGLAVWRQRAVLFGSTGSVWAYNRFADALLFVARCLLAIPALHYVDDYGA